MILRNVRYRCLLSCFLLTLTWRLTDIWWLEVALEMALARNIGQISSRLRSYFEARYQWMVFVAEETLCNAHVKHLDQQSACPACIFLLLYPACRIHHRGKVGFNSGTFCASKFQIRSYIVCNRILFPFENKNNFINISLRVGRRECYELNLENHCDVR